MFKFIISKGLLKFLGGLLACLIVLIFALRTEVYSVDPWQMLKEINWLINGYILAIFLAGNYAWHFVYRIPSLGNKIAEHFLPNLNGTWNAMVHSKDEGTPKKGVVLTVEMNLSLFSFSMTSKSDDKDLTSHLTSYEIWKDENSGKFLITYTFEASVARPSKTDVGKFYGSARLEYDSKEDNFKGVYWTNRAYHINRQTAGDIEIVRLQKLIDD
jgi:hypothetical protein